MKWLKCMLISCGLSLCLGSVCLASGLPSDISGNVIPDQETVPDVETEMEMEMVPETEMETVFETEMETGSDVSGNTVPDVETEVDNDVESAEIGAPDAGDQRPMLVLTPADAPDLFSNYIPYDGTISTTYVTYYKGIASKLGFRQHYVLWRASQYQYKFAYGDNLVWDGSRFTGDVSVITYDTYNSNGLSYSIDSTFVLNPGSYMVYSDLTDRYPQLVEGVRTYEVQACLFMLAIVFVFGIVKSFFISGRS